MRYLISAPEWVKKLPDPLKMAFLSEEVSKLRHMTESQVQWRRFNRQIHGTGGEEEMKFEDEGRGYRTVQSG